MYNILIYYVQCTYTIFEKKDDEYDDCIDFKMMCVLFYFLPRKYVIL